MSNVSLPILNESRCTACGDCVAICPTHCLEILAELVWLPRPAECVSCGACRFICPEDAIAFEDC